MKYACRKFEVDEEYKNYGYIWPDKVDYVNRNLPLADITAPIPRELIDPVYCMSILKSGNRKGEHCHRLVKGNNIFCTIHSK